MTVDAGRGASTRLRHQGWFALVLALALVAAACGGGGGGREGGADGADRAGGAGTGNGAGGDVVAQVASYEVVSGRPQRLIVGLVREGDDPKLVSFGEVGFSLRYLGTRQRPLQPPRPGPQVKATFRPLPGQHVDPASPGPRLVDPSQGVGVYGVDSLVLDEAGFWEVEVTADLSGTPTRAASAFEVLAAPVVPAPGQPAPRTHNPLPGAAGVNPKAVDSRFAEGEPLPDPELHTTTVADAIAAGRPVMVVVSTPVYCQSRFCGPVTDSVQALARRFGDRMAFVHIEVWEDFEAQKLNPAAKEWIAPPGADAREPWIFLVGADGIVVDRWDNVATDTDLERAVTQLLG